jgi:hypothetical protein
MGWQRRHAAELREAGLGAQPLGVVASGHQECSRHIGADPLEGAQLKHDLLGETLFAVTAGHHRGAKASWLSSQGPG